MGDACLRYSIDKGLGGGAPNAPPPFVAMCHIYAESVPAFQAAFGPHMREIMADVANYTDLQPQMMVSEVVRE